MQGRKTGGRVAGTPNRITNELRETLRGIIAAELDALPQTLEGLPPKDRLELVLKLMPFCLPKVQSVSATYDTPSLFADWGV